MKTRHKSTHSIIG